MYPRIDLHGKPHDRGVQYGKAARDRILASFEGYGWAFAHFAGWDWGRVREEAEKYREPIAAYDEKYLEELDGIAAGADVDERDLLAINCRTEIMFSAQARRASAMAGRVRLPLECSAFAALPHRTAAGRLLAGQTWDWLTHSRDSLVLLVVHRQDGPDFATVTEAGLLAKFGMNSSGISVCTNALVCDSDRGDPGVPYHVLLRALLESDSLQSALTAIVRQSRASSANYLLADADGVAINIEAAPGDYSRVYPVYPEDGVVLHTNHFLASGNELRDVYAWAMPDSPFRLVRLRAMVEESGDQLDLSRFQKMLADHAGHPSGVCCHPDRSAPEAERYITAAAVIMDPAARRMWLTGGPPCENDFEILEFGEEFSSARL